MFNETDWSQEWYSERSEEAQACYVLKGLQVCSPRTVDLSLFPNEGMIPIYVDLDNMVFQIKCSEINHKIFEFQSSRYQSWAPLALLVTVKALYRTCSCIPNLNSLFNVSFTCNAVRIPTQHFLSQLKELVTLLLSNSLLSPSAAIKQNQQYDEYNTNTLHALHWYTLTPEYGCFYETCIYIRCLHVLINSISIVRQQYHSTTKFSLFSLRPTLWIMQGLG